MALQDVKPSVARRPRASYRNRGNAKLCNREVQEIRRWARTEGQGFGQTLVAQARTMAARYHMSDDAIKEVLRNTSWYDPTHDRLVSVPAPPPPAPRRFAWFWRLFYAIPVPVALALLVACGPTPRPRPPVTPPLIVGMQICAAIWQDELGRPIDPAGLQGCLAQGLAGASAEQIRASVRASAEWKALHAPPPVVTAPVLHADGKVFRTATGAAWRWRGVSAFALLDRFAKGEDIGPFLAAYTGYNVLRVWPYVQGPGWGTRGWESPSVAVMKAFLSRVAADGWTVELTLLTDDDPVRLAWAKALVPQLAAAPRPTNLLIEIGNEPDTNKRIDTAALRSVLDASGFVYASGNYEDSRKAFGSYLVTHTSRDREWPRRAHDCLEFWNGGGPNTPADPAHRVPCVLDEPAKLQDVQVIADDWRAYFGTAALLSAGATFHCETCKFAQLPTPDEAAMAAAALEGLTAFKADAPLGAYRRPVESSLRTYAVGPCMVRVRPTTPDAPESGWTRTGASDVLWRR